MSNKVVQLGIVVRVENGNAIVQTERLGAAHVAAANQVEQAGQRMAAATNDVTASQLQLNGAMRPHAAQLADVSNQHGRLQDHLRNSNNLLNQQAVSARQLSAAMRGVPAQFTDIVTSLQGGQNPLTVFLQQGGQLRDMFGSSGAAARSLSGYVMGLVNPFTVAAAAAGVAGLAYYQGSKEVDGYRHALLMTGNVIGTTSGQLADMATRVSGTIGTKGAAAAALTELVANGRVAAQNLEQIGAKAMSTEKYLGQSIATTAEHLADLAKTPLQTSEKLNQQYHYLTATVYDHIKALEDQGRIEAAGEVAQKAYSDALAERAATAAKNLGLLERGWNAVTGAAKSGWDAMLDIGRDDTLEEKLADAQKRLAKAKQARFTFLGAGKEGKAELDAAQALVDKITQQRDAEKWNAAAKAESVRLDEAHVRWVQMGVQYLDKEARLQLELNKTRQAGLDAGESDEAIEKRLAQVRKKMEEKAPAGSDARKASLDARLRAIQDELSAERDKFAHQERLAAIHHRGALLSDGEYYAARLASLEKSANAELASYDKQLVALRGFQAKSEVERQENLGRIAQVEAAKTRLERQTANQREQLTAEEEVRKSQVMASSSEAMAKHLADLAKMAEAQEMENAGRVAARALIERETVARFDLAIAYQREFMAEQLANGARADEIAQAQTILKYLEDQRNAHVRLAGAFAKGDALKLDRQMWQDAEADAKSFAKALEDSFGKAGGAIGKMSLAMFDFQKNQRDIALELSRNKGLAGGDRVKLIEAEGAAAKETAKAQIRQYGDMSRAASGFFKENSAGYRALHGAEQAFRAFEMAMTVESMVKKLAATTTVTTATLAGEATKTTAVVASSTAMVAANTVVGETAAAAGVATQALGDPYTAWARMAAMAAIMVGLGFAVSGGSGGANLAKERQEAAGTGSVLGDRSAKSSSIANSLELISANSDIELNHTAGMLASLRKIESSTAGLSSLIVRADLSANGAGVNVDEGYEIKHGRMLLAAGAIGVAVSLASKLPLIGNLVTKLFGDKTSVVDRGITAAPTSLASIMADGMHGQSYADVSTTKKFLGISYSKKTSTELAPLADELNLQFGLVVQQLAHSVSAAADILGAGGDEFTTRLNQFVVDIGKISLKDLTGEQVQEQLEAVFSRVGDDLARHGVDGLLEFQKVGEGYLETLSRIANDYATLDALLAANGDTFGAVGLESVAARERVISLAGGIDKLAEQTQGFGENYLTEAERLAPVTKYVAAQMAALGLTNVTSREQFKLTALAIDKTTEAGAQQWAGMMALQEAFAKVHPEIEKTAEAARSAADILDERNDLQAQIDKLTMSSAQLRTKERDALDASNRLLFDQLTARQDIAAAYERESDALKATTDRLAKFKDSVLTFKDSLLLGNLSALTPLQKLGEAQRQYESLLAKAKAGDQAAQAQITNAASAYLQADQVIKASSDAYAADAAKVQRDLEELAQIAGTQATEAQKQLEALNSQVGQLINLNTTALGIQQAVLNLADVLGSGQTGGGAALQSGVVDQLYSTLLQRAPDVAGKQFWLAQMQQGVAYSQIEAAFKQSSEYKRLHGSHAGGLERVPFDGYLAELHRDEIVVDAQAAVAIRRYFGGKVQRPGGNQDDLHATLARLQIEMAGLRADLARHTGNQIHANAGAHDDSTRAIVGAIQSTSADAAFERMNRQGATAV